VIHTAVVSVSFVYRPHYHCQIMWCSEPAKFNFKRLKSWNWFWDSILDNPVFSV